MQRSTKAITISVLSLLLVGTASIATFGLTRHQDAPVAPQAVVSAEPQPPTRTELLKLVNEERARVGVAPLKEDGRLNTSAQRKADDMAKYNYFGHVSPKDHKHGYEYINDVGIYCRTDSENLHEGTGVYATSNGSVTGWLGSTPHRKAMLDTEYSLTGFGVSQGNGETYVVEHFCQQ